VLFHCRLSADGFGEQGRAGEVPPGASLEIELELLGWKRVEKVTREYEQMGRGSSPSPFACWWAECCCAASAAC
jgi:hypothetical protein